MEDSVFVVLAGERKNGGIDEVWPIAVFTSSRMAQEYVKEHMDDPLWEYLHVEEVVYYD